MYNTSFNLSTLNIDNVAIPYKYFLERYYQINELSSYYGDLTPPDPYWKLRCYPAGGLYTTVNDLSNFLIAHINEGVYKNNRILEKETVELMHTIQPNNSIGYGLAWMEYPISFKDKATEHGGDIMGVDTWMLHIPADDIGVIYFANGNPTYGLTPMIGSISLSLLLYSPFKEAGSLVSFSLDLINCTHYSLLNMNNFYYAKFCPPTINT
jgi:CubicO group peptidase (beta-lactamase class C family)